jgi:hypothetical protein
LTLGVHQVPESSKAAARVQLAVTVLHEPSTGGALSLLYLAQRVSADVDALAKHVLREVLPLP